MEIWGVPPRAKILQALSIISGKKIKWISSNIAEINGKKVQIKGNGVYANGNKYKYLDEKAIAVLMQKGKLPFSERIAEKLGGFDCFQEGLLSEIEKKVKQYLKQHRIYEKEVDAFISIVNNEIRKKKFEILRMKKSQSSIFGYTK